MSKIKDFDEVSGKFLGQQGSYAVQTDKFDSSFLVPMPRSTVRSIYGITGEEFVGYDIWHCHEATFLLNSGVPIAGTLKVVYSSSSEFMVESKSFKLYLNSFDMCKMGDSVRTAIENYENQIKQDLQKVLKSDVQLRFFWRQDQNLHDFFLRYSNIEDGMDLSSIEISDYTSQGQYLKFEPYFEEQEYWLKTNVLRSRCRHTKQKDTGMAFFYIKTKNHKLNLESLFRQVVSLRMLDEFHEFCAEKLYYELMSTGCVSECCVSLLYSRRGSLDINPTRATNIHILPHYYIDHTISSYKQQNQ